MPSRSPRKRTKFCKSRPTTLNDAAALPVLWIVTIVRPGSRTSVGFMSASKAANVPTVSAAVAPTRASG